MDAYDGACAGGDQSFYIGDGYKRAAVYIDQSYLSTE